MITAIQAAICLGEHNDACVQMRSWDIAKEPDAADIIELAEPGEEEKWVEVFFAVNYTLRQMSNLGYGSPLMLQLANGLRHLSYKEKGGRAYLGQSEVTLSTAVTSKQIEIELKFGTGGNAQLVVNHNGFGLWSRKAPQYVPCSVFALFRALSQRRASDVSFVRRLLIAGIQCVSQAHQLTLSNHARLALLVTDACWATSVEGNFEDDRQL